MRSLLLKIVGLIAAAALALLAWIGWFAMTPVGLTASPLDFSIKRGSSLRTATRQMIDAGIRIPAWPFVLLGRASSNQTSIKAGSYEVSSGVTPWDLMQKITQGDFAQSEMVFIEGWTFRQVRAALDANANVQHDTRGMSDAEVMRRLRADAQVAEGMFFPDTYLFGKGDSDLTILARAHRGMQKQLQSAWEQRAQGLPLSSPYEVLILASIIEKETGQASDRPMVAGVFINRLRAGMMLQTDPTVIYGLGERFDGNLRKRDLVTDGPFNTYTRAGLPPHPIGMPGQAALLAATNPAATNALYFVARGDGSSQFSRSLEDHNRAVAKYQRGAR
jgi:UPF0755 protein